MRGFTTRLLPGEEGATTAENALMVALIAAAALAVIGSLSTALNGEFAAAVSALGRRAPP